MYCPLCPDMIPEMLKCFLKPGNCMGCLVGRKKRHLLVLEEVSSSQGFPFCISKFRKQSLPLQWAKALAGPRRREAASRLVPWAEVEGRLEMLTRAETSRRSGEWVLLLLLPAQGQSERLLFSKEMKSWRETKGLVSLSLSLGCLLIRQQSFGGCVACGLGWRTALRFSACS